MPLRLRARCTAACLLVLFVPIPLAAQGRTPPTRTEATPQEPRVRTGREARGQEPGMRRPRDAEATSLAERTHLTGDWGGARSWLEQHGITPTLTLLTDSSVVLDGGVDRGDFLVRSLFDAEVEIDGERLFGLTDSRFFADLQVQNGRDGSQDTGDLQVYSNIDGPDRVQLAKLWYEQLLADDVLRVKLGKADTNTDFAYVEHGFRLIHSSFGFAPTILGFPTYPDPSFGAAAFVTPPGGFYAGAGIYDGATQAGVPTGPRGPRTVFGSPSDVFVVAETGLRHHEGDGELAGRVGAGVFHHSGDFVRGNGTATSSATGYFLVADQLLWRPEATGQRGPNERGPNERGIGAFVQYGYADPDVSLIEHYAGIGATWTGPFASRPDDACGFGVAWALFRDLVGDGARGGGEVAIELFYTLQLTPWLRLKPDLQYIHDPSGDPTIADALVATLRVGIDF
jgi:porin